MAFTYRPSEKTQAELDTIKDKEGIKANTKALDYIIGWHIHLKSKVKDQEKKIRDLENELFEIKSILKRKNNADLEYQKLIDSLEKH